MTQMLADCVLCSFDRASNDWVTEWKNWKLIVNHNQNYLGKVMLVLKRHATDITNLTEQEQIELWSALRATQAALVAAFHPDHFNYAFLMNQDAHVHLHIIPRYGGAREFEGQIFTDGHPDEHYALTSQIGILELRSSIVRLLRAKGLSH